MTRAFTLIEILIVVTIIAVLAALILAANPLGQGQRAANDRLTAQVGEAITTYLQRWPLLPIDFATRPYWYLNRALVTSNQAPLLELPRTRLLIRTGAGVEPAAREELGEAMRDWAGGQASELRIWVPAPRPVTNRRQLTHALAIWTDNGTEATNDDSYAGFIVDEARWRRFDRAGFLAFKAAQE